MRDITVFSGSAHPELAEEICSHLGVPLHPVRVSRFANDVLEVQLQANCRERDVEEAPRISLGGRLVADLMVAAGAGRVLAMTLHSPQVHGFFSVPVDHLHALRELAAHFARYDLSNTVVVSPDLGYAKEAAALARRQAHRPVHRPRPRRGHAPHPLRRVGQRAVQYILMICPVTFRPWWEARNVITSATSSARAIRRSGLSPARASLESSPIHPVSVTGG